MERLRKGSITKRIAISVIALYALLLQGMFAPSAAAVGSLSQITCAQNGSGSQAPGGEHHHGLCCILACAASGSVFVVATAGIVVFLLRALARLDYAQPPTAVARASAQFYLPARGPPQAL
jgi:hypothetical protein